MEFIKLYVISFISLIGLDSVWLTLISPKLYKSQIGHLMAKKPNLPAALLFYMIYIVGAVAFVVQPAVAQKSLWFAASRGALLGLVAYATFDLTSLAVLRDWPLKITLIDLTWGTILTAAVCTLATFIALKLA